MVQRFSPSVVFRTGFRRRFAIALRKMLGSIEPVELLEQRCNFLPRKFRWRGDLWRVRRVERVWEQTPFVWGQPRRYFRVVCQDDSCCMLFQDLTLGTWHVSV